MKLYPKKDIKNMWGQIIWHKDKVYNATKMLNPPGYENELDDYVVQCELIGNEYPMLSMEEINQSFYTEEQLRDLQINKIIK
jgi:hypothetical protein